MSEEKPVGTIGGRPIGERSANLPARQVHVTHDVVPLLDTGKFEQMQRVAAVMAKSALIPEHLRKGGGEQAIANCFLVINQAVMWEVDPFALAQSVSVVHGRICYEGKVIHAMIEAQLGVRLRYEYFGDVGTERRGIKVLGRFKDEEKDREIEGTVADWKVTHKKKDESGETTSAWVPKTYDRMLAYRGAREWCRRHAPGVILGVYSRDEMFEMEQEFDDEAPPPAPKNIDVSAGVDRNDAGTPTRPNDGRGPDRPSEEKAELASANPADDLEIPPELRRAKKAEPPVQAIDTSKKADAEDAEVVEDMKVEATIPPQDDDEPPSAPQDATTAEEEPAKAPTADTILDAAEVDFRACKTPAEVKKVQQDYAAKVAKMLPPDQQEFQNMAEQALKRTAQK